MPRSSQAELTVCCGGKKVCELCMARNYVMVLHRRPLSEKTIKITCPFNSATDACSLTKDQEKKIRKRASFLTNLGRFDVSKKEARDQNTVFCQQCSRSLNLLKHGCGRRNWINCPHCEHKQCSLCTLEYHEGETCEAYVERVYTESKKQKDAVTVDPSLAY